MKRPTSLRFRALLAACAACLWSSAAAASYQFAAGDFLDIEFVGEAVVAIDADGSILRSTDGGITFELRFQPDPVEGALALAVAAPVVVAVCEGGVIVRSEDGGLTWADVTPSLAVLGSLTSVATDENGIWIAAGRKDFGGYILRSTDNGLGWTEVAVSQPGRIESVAYAASTNVWLAGGSNLTGVQTGFLLRSTNAGAAWSPVVFANGIPAVYGVAADGEGRFAAVGEEGFVGIVGDGGLELAASYGQLSETLAAVSSQPGGAWLAAGQESVVVEFSADDGFHRSVAREAVPGAPNTTALSRSESGQLIVAGSGALVEKWLLPKLRISPTSVGVDVALTDLLWGASYELRQSTDLVVWTTVQGGLLNALQPEVVWSYDLLSGPLPAARFWRLRER